MKLQNMKLAQKWREYAGPKDERLEAENAKIYKLGFSCCYRSECSRCLCIKSWPSR